MPNCEDGLKTLYTTVRRSFLAVAAPLGDENALAWNDTGASVATEFLRTTINAFEKCASRHRDDAYPDGHGKLELTKFHTPKLVDLQPAIAPPNALGVRSVMFTVESVDDTIARLRAHGAELIGEVAQYEDKYRLCYMRGPAGISSRWPRSSSDAIARRASVSAGRTNGAARSPIRSRDSRSR